MLYLVKTVTEIVALLLLAVVLVSPANNAFSADNNAIKEGSVVAFRLNVRVAPSNKSQIYFVLKKGARIKIHGETGWFMDSN